MSRMIDLNFFSQVFVTLLSAIAVQLVAEAVKAFVTSG